MSPLCCQPAAAIGPVGREGGVSGSLLDWDGFEIFGPTRRFCLFRWKVTKKERYFIGGKLIKFRWGGFGQIANQA